MAMITTINTGLAVAIRESGSSESTTATSYWTLLALLNVILDWISPLYVLLCCIALLSRKLPLLAQLASHGKTQSQMLTSTKVSCSSALSRNTKSENGIRKPATTKQPTQLQQPTSPTSTGKNEALLHVVFLHLRQLLLSSGFRSFLLSMGQEGRKCRM